MQLSEKEIASLREVLRITIGSHADDFTNEYLNEFGVALLEATAVVLKAKQSQRKIPLEEH